MHGHEKVECVALSNRARAAITAGAIDTLRQLYAADAEFYLYFMGPQRRHWKDVEALLTAITQSAKAIEFRDVRVTPIDGGFVQQHALVVTKHAGTEGVMHGIIVFRTRADGTIWQMEEYGDASGIV